MAMAARDRSSFKLPRLLAFAVALSATGAEGAAVARPQDPASDTDLAGRTREPVFWVHLHNSGGTSLMTLAEINLETPIAPASANWNRYQPPLLRGQPTASATDAAPASTATAPPLLLGPP